MSSALALTLAGGPGACGGGASGAHNGPRSQDAVAVRVGDTPISAAAVTHWMTIMAPQHVVPEPPGYTACIAHRRAVAPQAATAELKRECGAQYAALRQQVLSFLISSQWLIGEASEEGMPISRQEVQRRLAEKERSYAGGVAEFMETERAIAHTVADVELEIRAELASEKVRRRLASGEPRITETRIASYYRQNMARYHVPERRYFYIVENLPSVASAEKAMAQARGGRRVSEMGLSESLPRRPFSYDNPGEKRTIYEAIFKAAPHALTGPIRLGNLYFLIEVFRIGHAHVESFAQVRDAIGTRLRSAQRQRTLAAFIAAWRHRWTARTDCSPGYMVQKCRRYSGPKAPEEPLQLK